MTRIVLIVFGIMALFPPRAFAQSSSCGWYAITYCKPTYEEASAFAKRTGTGYVLNTSSPEYPNFASGFFCVAAGPMDRETAISTVDYWRSSGVSLSAYAKSAC
ncbi:hypothetical protein [Bradyrhizobium uaiense]|uniref:SPOR domain-containing protein n=1 Tax=Bradyrhizobium uaiense TaxID=2594946 RepID=A0A6P1BV02_9BRAD|nr:hypothetical protein [Bradyrhizobium uaiense]NEV01372.1 hypothetical protein [Bradyrhizobium uaiense]